MRSLAFCLSVAYASTMSAQTFNDAEQFESKYPDFACDVDKGRVESINSVEDLKRLGQSGQENLDRLYATLTAGSMPEGFYNGTIIFAESENDEFVKALVASFQVSETFRRDPRAALTKIGELLWKGKRFKQDPYAHPHPSVQTRILANKMPAGDLQGAVSSIFGSAAARQLEGVGALNQWRFPAKVFCGQSLLDNRRESIVIDYAATADFGPSYDPDQGEDKFQFAPAIDVLAGVDGLQVRDEIRMVRPGLYLGRAYMGRAFVLNFVLQCDTSDTSNPCNNVAVNEACAIGTQRTNQLVAAGNYELAAGEQAWKRDMAWIPRTECLSHQEFHR